KRGEAGGRRPAVLHGEGWGQGRARDIESASLVAENKSPPAGPHGAALAIAAERDRPGARDGDDAGFSRGGSGKCDDRVRGGNQLPGPQCSRQNGLLVIGAAAHSKTGSLEANRFVIEAGSATRLPDPP